MTKFLIPSLLVLAQPTMIFAADRNIYDRYYSSDQFSFSGRKFNELSEEFSHATYETTNPDHKVLLNETPNTKYRFDWRNEFTGSGKEKERISRITETSSSGIGDNRIVSISTATFYNNDRLRARTVCSGDVSDQMHCVTATQKSCRGVLEKYKQVTQATKGKSALLSKDPAENEKNIRTCQNLMQGYADVAGASYKYMKSTDGYNDVVRTDSVAIQDQSDLVFGKRKVIFSNINANVTRMEDLLETSTQAQAGVRLLASPSGIELVHKLIQACRESQRDFDTDRLGATDAKAAAGAEGSR